MDGAPCPDKPEVVCGTVTVPVGWPKPNGPTIQVAPARGEATDPGCPHRDDAVRPGWPRHHGLAPSKHGEMNLPKLL